MWVYHLTGIYLLNQEGYVRDSGGPQVEKIRRIGRTLNQRGGMEMMQTAHAKFASRSNIPGAARNLEHLWDQIGEWSG